MTKIEHKLKESYKHIKMYLDEEDELKKMCKNCEAWTGNEHDYDGCLKKPCFRFYLAYAYLEWETSWEQEKQ